LIAANPLRQGFLLRSLGPGNYGGQDGKQATSRPCRIPSQRLRELIEASSRRRVTLAGKLRIYADRKAEPLIRSRLSCTVDNNALCGFSTTEIAIAFLTTASVRARSRLGTARSNSNQTGSQMTLSGFIIRVLVWRRSGSGLPVRTQSTQMEESIMLIITYGLPASVRSAGDRCSIFRPRPRPGVRAVSLA
jgi:hypothetical protein